MLNGWGLAMFPGGKDATPKAYAEEVARVLRLALGGRGARIGPSAYESEARALRAKAHDLKNVAVAAAADSALVGALIDALGVPRDEVSTDDLVDAMTAAAEVAADLGVDAGDIAGKVKELRGRAEAAEREAAEVCRWVEFGRRLAHEQATHILALQRRIVCQRGQLSGMHVLYEDKLQKTGVAAWAKTCVERYYMVRRHYSEIATERNALKLRAELAEAALAAAAKFVFAGPGGIYVAECYMSEIGGRCPHQWEVHRGKDSPDWRQMNRDEAIAAARKLAKGGV